MRLLVARDYNKDMVDDECHLATHFLQLKATHLFIASYKWDYICIEIDDCIPEGYLRYLPIVCSNIQVKLPETLTEHTMALLTEVYPDKAGVIRKAYMLNQSMKGALEGCLAQ